MGGRSGKGDRRSFNQGLVSHETLFKNNGVLVVGCIHAIVSVFERGGRTLSIVYLVVG